MEESVQYLDDSNVANMDPTPGLTLKSFGRRHDVFRYDCIFDSMYAIINNLYLTTR